MTRTVKPPLPRAKVHDVMCKRCPFRPDGSGYAQDHPDLPRIVQSVEMGLPFFCHETALEDPRTKLTASGYPDGVQVHFELCRGARERHLQVWREKVRAAGYEPEEP